MGQASKRYIFWKLVLLLRPFHFCSIFSKQQGTVVELNDAYMQYLSSVLFVVILQRYILGDICLNCSNTKKREEGQCS
jgi:hypothetical protein